MKISTLCINALFHRFVYKIHSGERIILWVLMTDNSLWALHKCNKILKHTEKIKSRIFDNGSIIETISYRSSAH